MKAWGVAAGLAVAYAAWAVGRAGRDGPDSSVSGQVEEAFIEQVAELCVAGLERNLDASEDVRRAAIDAICGTLRCSDSIKINAEPALNPLMRLEMRIRRLDPTKVERTLGIIWTKRSGADTIMVADEVMWENLPGQYRERFIREGTDQQVYLLYQRVKEKEGES